MGLFADGDNAAAKGGSLKQYTAPELTAAKVCGVLEVTTAVVGWHEVGVPAGWKDDGATLTAPNGIAVVRGFRDYILSHSWNPRDEPQAVEAHVSQVEVYDPAQGAVAIQPFALTGQLCWTAARGVWVSAAGRRSMRCERNWRRL